MPSTQAGSDFDFTPDSRAHLTMEWSDAEMRIEAGENRHTAYASGYRFTQEQTIPGANLADIDLQVLRT